MGHEKHIAIPLASFFRSMTVRGLLESYLLVRPVGLRNCFRLYAGYIASLMVKVIIPHRFRTIGHLIPGSKPVTVSVSGVLALIRPQTADLGMLAAPNERVAARWFEPQPGDVVVDIGAHIGRFTLKAAKSAAKVIAVEPVQSNFSMLEANIELNGFTNVMPLRLALSDHPGQLPLYLSDPRDLATSSFESNWSDRIPGPSARERLLVSTETLDNLASRLGIAIIDWLKIDVEGHETFVLKGAQLSLAKTRHLVIEVAEENERACRELIERSGLALVSVDKKASQVSDWFFQRS